MAGSRRSGSRAAIASQHTEQHTCGECAECEPVTKFHTLSVHGRKPTMGSCPYEEFCVLLSQRVCKEHFKEKI